MYVYVKFQDEKKCKIVESSKIKHFNPLEEYPSKKLYKIQWEDNQYYNAIILLVKDSINELNDAITASRPIIPPAKYLDPADPTTDSESGNTQKKEMNINNKALFEKKLRTMRNTINEHEESPVNISTKKGLQMKNIKKENVKVEKKGCKQDKKDSKPKKIQCDEGRKGANNASIIPKPPKPSTKKRKPKEEKAQTQNEVKQLKLEINRLTPIIENKENTKGINKESNNTRIISDEILNDKIWMKTDKEKESLKREIQILRANKRKLEETMKERDQEIKRLKEINLAFQDQVINGFREIRDVISENRQINMLRTNDIEDPSILHSVGYRRQMDDTIHFGRDIWIPIKSYDWVVNSSKTPAQFVKNCAVIIFTIETLKTHSVTGTISNAAAKKNKKPRPKLNDTKMLALKSIYEYYLRTNLKATQDIIDKELSRVDTYVSKKICDLNRPPKPKGNTKKPEPKMNIEENNSDDDRGDSDDNDDRDNNDDRDDNDDQQSDNGENDNVSERLNVDKDDTNGGNDSQSDDSSDEKKLIIDTDEDE